VRKDIGISARSHSARGNIDEMEQMSESPRREKRRVSIPVLAIAIVITAATSFVLGTRSDELWARISGRPAGQLDLSSLQQVYNVLNAKYDGQLDVDKLIDGAKHGLVDAAGDPYTTYFNAKEAAEFNGDLEGKFEGIGAELAKRDEKLIIVSTLDDSPAKAAGLLANDAIVKVNDEETTSWSIDKAVSKIRGEKGTTVKLSIVRGDNELKEFSITRDTINNPSVKSEVTADNIGIMRVSRFGQSDTVSLSRAAAEDFKSKGVKGVVVDLRGNGGGYLDAAVDLASIWLDDKVVVTERSGGKVTDTRKSGSSPILNGVPTIVLIDGGSASASEILAGALKDNGAATLLGAKTFGKGSVQVIENLPDGGGLKVTIAKWYTPKGRNINKEGIEPDEKVTLSAEDINANRDPQKDKAIEKLKAGL
jgi:carboxyl-terminal processing protease